MNKKIILIIFILLLGTAVFSYRVKIKNFYYDLRKDKLPATVDILDLQEPAEGELMMIADDASDSHNQPEVEKEEEINLAVPFMVQAPHADWSMPYKEACEEASILMAVYYLQSKELDEQTAKTEINKMVEWQIVQWGGHYDLSIKETAELTQKYFSDYKIIIIPDLTVDKIKIYLKQGYPVVVPVAGRQLGNPFFQNPGPLYHMLVVKGYMDDKFITNDPGTKRGRDFVYNYEVLMSAINDWDGENPTGGKMGLVITD